MAERLTGDAKSRKRNNKAVREITKQRFMSIYGHLKTEVMKVTRCSNGASPSGPTEIFFNESISQQK